MKIAVCVKHVPEGSSRLDPQSLRLDRSGEGALNHFDANAVEEALRLKGDSDTEIIAVSLGPCGTSWPMSTSSTNVHVYGSICMIPCAPVLETARLL